LKTVFVVDDCEITLALIENALEDEYNVISLISAEKMFKLLERMVPDLIMLDIRLPGADGLETLYKLKLQRKFCNIPVIILSGHDEHEASALESGANDFIAKPFSAAVLCHRVKLHIDIDTLIQERAKQFKDLQNNVICVLAHMIEARDGSTGQHIERTTRYIKLLLDSMINHGTYINEIVEWDLDAVASSACLHDIGKVSIPDHILSKKGKLTYTEYETVKTHATQGEKIIGLIMDKTDNNEFLCHAKLFAGSHHERWDGKGYPRELKDLAIPLHGRIMAIVDVYDAITSVRPYKDALTHEEAIKIIESESGKQFDPKIVEIFLKIQEQLGKNMIANNETMEEGNRHGKT
jgi:putative two-component system response regulator